MSDAGTAAGGLRARKKQQTRERIATTASRLFRKRGYRNVRMVDIARAAEISEQTLYNYFATKEHLIFDLDREFGEMMVAVVAGAKSGKPLAHALRASALNFLKQMARSVGRDSGIPASVATGPALRRVWVEMNARHADRVAEELLRQNRRMSTAEAKTLARSIVAVFAVILEEVGVLSLAGKTRAAVLKNLRPPIESVMDTIEFGLAHRSRRAPGFPGFEP